MKKQILLLLLVITPALLHAQQTKFGLKGGMYFSSLNEDIVEELNGLTLTALHDRYTGFHLGVVGSFVFPGFFIQPEVLWVTTGRDMVIEHAGIVQDANYYTQRFQHMSVPVLFGMKVGPVKIGAGPVLSVLLSQRNDSIYPLNIRHRLNNATLGYQIGAGLQVGALLFDLRYEGNLSRYGDGISVGDVPLDFDMRPRQIIFGIGLLF